MEQGQFDFGLTKVDFRKSLEKHLRDVVPGDFVKELRWAIAVYRAKDLVNWSIRDMAELFLDGIPAIPSEESAVIDLIVDEFYDSQDLLGVSPQNITEWIFGEVD